MVRYSTKDEENTARVFARNLSISTKYSVEICRNIRGKPLNKAKKLLEDVLAMERPIVMARFTRDIAHKKGTGPGKYPIEATKKILAALKSAESNAQNKGLSTNDMYISHISAHKASRPWHYGRQRRRRMKRTHVEIVLKEEKVSK